MSSVPTGGSNGVAINNSKDVLAASEASNTEITKESIDTIVTNTELGIDKQQAGTQATGAKNANETAGKFSF